MASMRSPVVIFKGCPGPPYSLSAILTPSRREEALMVAPVGQYSLGR